jgi:hypothetical protein
MTQSCPRDAPALSWPGPNERTRLFWYEHTRRVRGCDRGETVSDGGDGRNYFFRVGAGAEPVDLRCRVLSDLVWRRRSATCRRGDIESRVLPSGLRGRAGSDSATRRENTAIPSVLRTSWASQRSSGNNMPVNIFSVGLRGVSESDAVYGALCGRCFQNPPKRLRVLPLRRSARA